MIPSKMLSQSVALFLLISASLTECRKVDELMTDAEIYNLFRTTRDKIPEYEMVEIQHTLHKRSAPQNFRFDLNAFDMDIAGYVDPIDGVLFGENTPVWVAENYGERAHYRQLKKGIMKEVLGVYQGVSSQAALLVRSRDGQELQFHGTVQGLTIAPLPQHVQEELKRTEKKKRDLPKKSRTMKTSEYHIVFKSNPDANETASAQQPMGSNEETSMPIDVSRTKRSYKDMVFPTILATTDFNIAVKSDDDSAYYEQIMYQMAFWNGVDLKYRPLSNPEVHLRIAGIIIAADRFATPYIKKNLINGDLDTYSALQDMQAYWDEMRYNDEFSSDGFHIVATATNLKLYAKDLNSKTSLLGLAAVSSICYERDRKFYPTTIFKDDLAFGGINVAVHELGHIFGANHDQGECPISDGFIMAPTVSSTPNNLKWSKCSLERMEKTLRLRACVDKPKEHYPSGKSLDRIMPGSLKTSHEQCQARGYDWACATTPDICKVLKCYHSGISGFFKNLNMCQNTRSAAEGTECAPGSYCINGQCRHP